MVAARFQPRFCSMLRIFHQRMRFCSLGSLEFRFRISISCGHIKMITRWTVERSFIAKLSLATLFNNSWKSVVLCLLVFRWSRIGFCESFNVGCHRKNRVYSTWLRTQLRTSAFHVFRMELEKSMIDHRNNHGTISIPFSANWLVKEIFCRFNLYFETQKCIFISFCVFLSPPESPPPLSSLNTGPMDLTSTCVNHQRRVCHRRRLFVHTFPRH